MSLDSSGWDFLQHSGTICFIAFVCVLPALARRASDHSNSVKQPAEVDPNKKRSARKAKAGIKVRYSLQQVIVYQRVSSQMHIREDSFF